MADWGIGIWIAIVGVLVAIVGVYFTWRGPRVIKTPPEAGAPRDTVDTAKRATTENVAKGSTGVRQSGGRGTTRNTAKDSTDVDQRGG